MLDTNSIYSLFKLTKYLTSRLKSPFSRVIVPDKPHFDPQSIEKFKHLIGQSEFYLEFGSGGSTVLAATLNLRSISVESDRHFAQAVRDKIGSSASVKVIHGDIGLTEGWGYPVFGRPTLKRMNLWSNYTRKAFEVIGAGGRFPDLVLIDGRFRRACAMEVARQAELAGASTTLFFDDYAGRDHYHAIEELLGEPTMAGRAAIFLLEPGCLRQEISEQDVFEAYSDSR